MEKGYRLLAFLLFSLVVVSFGQSPVEKYVSNDFVLSEYEEFSEKKKFPRDAQPQVLTALSHYPQLKDTRIVFRFRKRKTPLTSRPRISHVFLPKKWRTYVITISTETAQSFAPILFSKLPYNAQIGVLGHEIAHILEYRELSSFQLIGLGFKMGKPDFVDRFEFKTDERTIANGLGHQLLNWSIFVREALGIVEWKGASEELESGNAPEVNQRYMNPATIKKYMAKSPQYRSR